LFYSLQFRKLQAIKQFPAYTHTNMKKILRYTRRSFIQNSVVTGLALTFNLYSCTKSTPSPDKKDDTPSPNDQDDNKLKITGVNLPVRIDSSKGAELSIQGKGFASGDQIVFESTTDKYTIDTKTVSATGVTFVLPQDITQSNYKIYVKRGTQTFLLGTTVLNLYFNPNIPDKPGMTVKGVVYSGGVGMAGVVVSDGFEVATTNANGIYYLPSAKKSKYVFVSIPGNYEVDSIGSAPQFFQRLTQSTNVVEVKDFELKPVNNEKHVVMVLGDMHLAKRTDDLNQFRNGFLPDVNQSIQAYKNAGNKVYALTLGDMTWDGYWYSNNYGLMEYLTEMNKINAQVFNTMGNHDNDMKFFNDWDAEGRFRDVIGPTYYSFNLGKVHYIVLDNIEYLNTNETRNYNNTIIADQIAWLKKDLATITDKDTPIIVAMHIHLYKNPGLSGTNETYTKNITNTDEFVSALSSFTKVNVLTGHTHINYNVENPTHTNIMEHNIAAVCATWWWTGYLSGNHVCKDGAPGGYAIWEANGRDQKWSYKSTGEPADYQFRTYDLNKVHITKEKFAPKYTGNDWSTYAGGYDTVNTNNEVLINVWNYDKKWKVEVTENDISLTVTRVRIKDPAHIISYAAQRLNDNAVPTEDFVTTLTAHMFKVKASSPNSTLKIKVTDRFGKVYEQTMVRPKDFSITNIK